MNLILAEKPSVAKNIAFTLNSNNRKDGYFEGDQYIVTFAFGHLYELYDVKDYENGFEKWEIDKFPFLPKDFKYKIKDDSGVKKQVGIINKLLKRNDIDTIIVATDDDREGQLIWAEIWNDARVKCENIKRLLINSHTPKEISKGMNNLKDYKDTLPLEKAAYCRQQMDWLFGINFTSLATLKYGNGKLLNVGRVILPTVKLIYDRDMEITNFKKETYYQLKAIFDYKGQQYESYYIDNNKNDRFEKKEILENISNSIKDKYGSIIEKEEKVISEQAPLLFNLSDLQGYITSKYNGFTSDKVLKIAQSLYENKYISYPRTASRHLDDTQVKEIENVVNTLSEKYSSDYNIIFKATKRNFDSSKVDSHPALTPTYILPNLDSLTKDEAIVYSEIERRFLAQFMPFNEYLDIKLLTRVDDYTFLSKEKSLIKEGWIKLYKEDCTNKTGILSNLKENDIVKNLYSNVIEKETEPPKHYTEKTLLKSMENCGKKVSEENVENILKGYSIGTAATRSETIKKIIDVGYVTKKGKSLLITDMGKKLIKVFPIKELMDTDFTGRIEKSLKDIEKGKINPDVFMERMKEYTNKSSDIIKKSNGSVVTKETIDKKQDKEIIGKCPECGNDIIAGKKAYGCSNWRNGCNFAIWYNQLEKLGMKKISKTTARKLLNNEKVSLKLKSAKTGKNFECLGVLEKENNRWNIKLEFL